MSLSDFSTKRALRKQIKRLKEDVKYRDKIIDDFKTDYAIAKSLIKRQKRVIEKLQANKKTAENSHSQTVKQK